MRGSVFTEEFFRGLDRSVREIADAEALPPECYTDPAFFDFEKEAVFGHEWLCIGRESWVANPGDYFTTSIVGEPLIAVRTREGELKALSAVCQHRAMLVAEGHGNAYGFTCPYHHWSYALDGRLVGAPAMDKTRCFDKRDIRLPELKVETWLGFLFVNFDRAAAPLAPRLAALAGALENWQLTEAEGERPPQAARYPFNWKVMFENNNDGYHANRLHKGPLHDFVPSSLATFPELPADTAGYFRYNGTTHPDAGFNATQKAVLPVFPHLTSADRNRMVFANVPPTLSLVMCSDMVIYMILRADTAETHEMDTGLLFAPGAMREASFEPRLAMTTQAVQTIIAQDLHVDELVQVGLRSRFAVRGRYSWQEGAQRQLNCWLVPRYQECWRKMRSGAPGRG